MKFNEKLTYLRKKQGLSQEELGEKLDVTRQTISKWELGQTTPEIDKLSEISNLFGLSIDDLLNDNEDLKKEDNKGDEKKNNNNRVAIKVIIVIAIIIALIGILFYVFVGMFFKKARNTSDERTKDLALNILSEASQKINDADEEYKNKENQMKQEYQNDVNDMYNKFFEFTDKMQEDYDESKNKENEVKEEYQNNVNDMYNKAFELIDNM